MSLLVTVTGRDHPGVTAGLLEVVAEHGGTLEDAEQVVVHGRLLLGLVLGGEGDGVPLRAGLAARAQLLDVDVEFTALDGDSAPPAREAQHVVTLLGAPVPPAAFAGLARRLAACGANIDRVLRLSSWPATSYELLVSGGDTGRLRRELAVEAVAQRVDVAVEPVTLWRRARRLVVLDVDSTLVQGEVIELLAARVGLGGEVAAITEAAMRGDLDFEQSLRRRVALLAGLDVRALEAVRAELQLTPGARTLVRTLKRLGYVLAVVSGGFTQVTDGLVAELGIDHAAANTLEVADGRLTGRLVGPVLDRAGKARALERFAAAAGVPVSQTVAIGDGANDLDMLTRAGLGIAFNAKPVVRRAADTAVTVPYLDAILFLLGITREEVEAADAEDPATAAVARIPVPEP